MQIRILILVILFFIFQSVEAQSFEVIVEDTLLIEPDPNVLLSAHADVKNITNTPIKTLVSREEISIAPSHFNYFCWGVNCYAPTTIVSPDTILLEPQVLNGTFKGYIDPDGTSGASYIRYCFINAVNPTDRVCFNVKYLVGTTAIERPDPGKPVTVPASYDSYSQTIKVNVNGGKIEIMNMLGQKVDLTFRFDGTGMVADASTLKTGYYFLFGVNEKGPWSARVIVTK